MYKSFLEEDIKITKTLISLENEIKKAIKIIYQTVKKKNKIFICGNGGSAADAQHLSAEFMVRLRPKINRKPIPLISLMQDSSTFSACANDYDFRYIFSRNLDAMSKKNDLLICLTTSGNSKNIIRAFKKAKDMNLLTIGICGENGIKDFKPDVEISIPSIKTPLIQEMHGITIHLICDLVESSIFS